MRLEGIDLLRGMAVSAVIIYHFFVLMGLQGTTYFSYIRTLGLFGVSLFFIISGFLIYRSVEYSISNKGIKNGLKHYTLHRLFRILPAYYFNFFVIIVMASFIIGADYLYSLGFLKQILSHLSFLSYFMYKDAGLGINGAYWTLSIEMLWYIMAPILFIYLKKDRYLVLLFIGSLLFLYGLDMSWYDSFLNLDKNASNYMLLLYFISFQLPGQFIYFITGIFIYKYIKKDIPLSAPVKYISSTVVIALFIYVEKRYNLHSNFLMNNLFILGVVTVLFLFLFHSKPHYMRAIEWIGKISYSLYLWHMPLLYIMNKTNILMHLSLLKASIVFVFFLLIISSLSYYLIEEGGFNLRKKLEHFFSEKKDLTL